MLGATILGGADHAAFILVPLLALRNLRAALLFTSAKKNNTYP
jgi:hypothetical protein